MELIEARSPYAVIVSDMQMPGMDGIQFLWSARAASPDLLEKVYAGSPLTKDEQEMFASHPSVGHDLLIGIPRLQSVAKMIEKQQEPYKNFAPPKKAVAELLELPETFNPRIVSALDTLEIGKTGAKIQLVKIRDMDMQMIIDQEIWTNRGLLVVPRGQEINHSVQVRLRNFSRSGVIPDQVRVLVPQFSVRDTNHAEAKSEREEMVTVKED